MIIGWQFIYLFHRHRLSGPQSKWKDQRCCLRLHRQHKCHRMCRRHLSVPGHQTRLVGLIFTDRVYTPVGWSRDNPLWLLTCWVGNAGVEDVSGKSSEDLGIMVSKSQPILFNRLTCQGDLSICFLKKWHRVLSFIRSSSFHDLFFFFCWYF